jgi:hypothetical protein
MNMSIVLRKPLTNRRRSFYVNRYEATEKYMYTSKRKKFFYILSLESKRRKIFYINKYEKSWDTYIHTDTFEKNFMFGCTFGLLHMFMLFIAGIMEEMYIFNYYYKELFKVNRNSYIFLYDYIAIINQNSNTI